MKYIPNIAGGLLGLAFIAFASIYFFDLMPAQPAPPKGSPVDHFMTALAPSGYMSLVKVCELVGGILVAIPLTRNFGLFVLGPVISHILAFHIFLTDRSQLASPPLVLICVLAAYLLWSAKDKFRGLLNQAH